MKINRKNYSFFSRVAASGVLIGLIISGCSDDKTPPDEFHGHASYKLSYKSSASSCSQDEEAFHQCAVSVVSELQLTDSEKDSLTACGLNQATSEVSSSDAFEAARSAIISTCL